MIYSVLALAAFAGTTLAKDLDLATYSFEQFVEDYHHDFKESELAIRKELFRSEVKRVIEHNNKGLWTEGINKFSAAFPSEKKARLGHKKSVARNFKPKHLQELPSDFKLKPVSELPESVDWRNTPNVVSAVKDQGHCGSCWAFAASAVLESHVALSTGQLYNLSPQQIAMCAPNPQHCGGTGGCEGATAELAFDYVADSEGTVQEYEIGYSAYYGSDAECAVTKQTLPVATITGYTQLAENNYTALMNAIAQVGPIAVSVDASTWSGYKGGIFNGCNQEQPDINHAVTLVGYGEEDGTKYWTIRNSWSPSWGELGYIRILRTDADEENCGTDITPQDGTACEGDNEPVKVCGTCGVLYDSAYPLGAKLA